MTPAEIPDWLKNYGPLGVAIWVVISSAKNRSPDNPPAQSDKHDKLEARVSELEKEVAILMDRSDR